MTIAVNRSDFMLQGGSLINGFLQYFSIYFFPASEDLSPENIEFIANVRTELTPVIAVPVQAQDRGSRYHGALAIIQIPRA